MHNYPFCWRCDTPLIYYARSTWFIRMTAVKEKLQASNQSVNWMPDNIRDGRMGNFIDNVLDWASPASATGARRCRCGSARTAATRT
jgi:isoleucyl-tRNA synthetase